jgi:ParB/RepB/Spo0J family partition protein
MLKEIDINKIDPSPFQTRKSRDEGKLKELGASIERDSQIEPIVVRPNGGRHYQLIVGHRRVEAVREYTKMKTILARIIKVDDLQARRMSAAAAGLMAYTRAATTASAINPNFSAFIFISFVIYWVYSI